MRSSILALPALMATLARAQNSSSQGSASVTSIFLPGADVLPYVASVMGESGDVKTLAISCGPGVDSDTCGFPSSVTAICGPSTAYVSAAIPSATFEYDCKITGSTAAVCAETFQGDAGYIATGSVTASGLTSTVTTETLDASDISYVGVTITAGGKSAASVASAAGTQAASSAAASASTAVASAIASAAASSVASSVASASSKAAGGASQSGNSQASSSQVVQSQSIANPSVNSAKTVPATSGGVSSATSSAPIPQFTGAASKLSAIGNYAAGLLALAGMAL